MTFTHPHTIDNGSGEEITFLRIVHDVDGDRMELRNQVLPGAGPPMHVHYLQEECLTVVKGKIATQIAGESPVFYGPGQTALFKRGVAHRFWNAGEDVLICEGWVKPAHNLEYFLTEIYKSVKANGGKEPGAFDGAFLMSKYKTEFDMNDIPTFVKKVLFPVVLFFGKIAGKHRKFDGGPEPVKG
jgi:quercetin dioxygenase-like cupin family protein